MLTGQYQRSLDSKIRVTLPAPQRKQLGDVVILLRRQDALYGYSPEAYEAWLASLNLNPRNRDDATALRMLNAARRPLGDLEHQQVEQPLLGR